MRSQRSNLAKYLDDLFVSTPKAVRLGGYSLDTFYAPIQVEQQGRSQSLLAWIIKRTIDGIFLHPAYEPRLL